MQSLPLCNYQVAWHIMTTPKYNSNDLKNSITGDFNDHQGDGQTQCPVSLQCSDCAVSLSSFIVEQTTISRPSPMFKSTDVSDHNSNCAVPPPVSSLSSLPFQNYLLSRTLPILRPLPWISPQWLQSFPLVSLLSGLPFQEYLQSITPLTFKTISLE